MSKSEPKIGKWKLSVQVFREGTGQYFTSWNRQKIGGEWLEGGIGPYGDTQVLALVKAYQIIAEVLRAGR